jgi:hypothetical protein
LKFGIRDLNIMMLIIPEFHENQLAGGYASLMVVNKIT